MKRAVSTFVIAMALFTTLTMFPGRVSAGTAAHALSAGSGENTSEGRKDSRSKKKEKTVRTRPWKVQKVRAVSSDLREITVSWKKLKDADGYQVFYSYDADFGTYEEIIVRTNKVVLTGLDVRKICYVKVRPYKLDRMTFTYGAFSDTAGRRVTGKLIVIDAGHQGKQNASLEPIGPGARQKKKKVTSGTRGVVTKLYEFELNLTVSLKLRDLLEERGYQVVMIRTTHDVDISNAERAAIANEAKADAFIRIHANGSESSRQYGTRTISPCRDNPFPIRKLYKSCMRLSKCVLNGVCEKAGSRNLGVTESDDYTGINWCRVPVTILEMGYMSNAAEDRLLAKDSYQNRIVIGIADGLDRYFKIRR